MIYGDTSEKGVCMRIIRRFFGFLLFFVLLFSVPLPSHAMDELTLYATWQVQVTFDANGGTLMGGATDAERALAGQASGSLLFLTEQSAATGLTAVKDHYAFIEWNTKADGSGDSLDGYVLKGPVTFYAVYYQTDYECIEDEQSLTIPFDGWYRIQCWGAAGGTDYRSGGNIYGGSGGYTSGDIYLSKGDVIYVYVGGVGADELTDSNPVQWAGYNGGGAGPASGGSSGAGGGATDIRLIGGAWDDAEGLASRIMVAGGGGGGGSLARAYSGAAGGLTGSSVSASGVTVRGGSQTSAGSGGGFGYGGSSSYAGGGGGGGWYGGGCTNRTDMSGAGGSSYISGFAGCAESSTGLVFVNISMIAGGNTMPSTGSGLEANGHRGDGYCRITYMGTVQP